jgi:hypothetical protein
VLAEGRSVVTGHTHLLNCTRVSNSLGHFWGVDLGTMSALPSPAFTAYTEMAETGWASGFGLLSFDRSRLLWPELIHVVDEDAGLYSFRGQLDCVAEPPGRRGRVPAGRRGLH